nr:uncharacterized protein LOC111507909 [Leptinotarsa decemlineata]
MTKVQSLKYSTILQLYTRAEAPCRDYYGLTIAESCICLNVWKVTHGPHIFPKQKLSELEDFKYDKFLQEEIKNIFGESIHQYLTDLAERKITLHHLPTKVFIKILSYLDTNDVLRLSRTSKIFMELCNADAVWLTIFKKVLKRGPSREENRMAFDSGWKEVLKKRMAYIKKAFAENKLKKTPSVTMKKKLVNVK